MEAEIESRIVSRDESYNGDWQVDHGPFEDFSNMVKKTGPYLVQAVNNWSRVLQASLSNTIFIYSSLAY